MRKRIHTYSGESIDVTYDAARCIHAAECIKRLHTVFDTSKRPWVQPANEPAESVATTIAACPSSALHFARKDGGAAEAIPTQNTILLTRNGHLVVRGDFTVVNSAGETVTNDTRATLCRCGASQNKPFCDNRHKGIGFQAPGTIDQPPTVVQVESGGKLTIEATANGPLHISGNFTVLNESGEVIAQGTDEWFCRCGASANKPFCDSSHYSIGFVAE